MTVNSNDRFYLEGTRDARLPKGVWTYRTTEGESRLVINEFAENPVSGGFREILVTEEIQKMTLDQLNQFIEFNIKLMGWRNNRVCRRLVFRDEQIRCTRTQGHEGFCSE